MDSRNTKTDLRTARPRFAGFPDLRSNTTFTPLQFFTIALPYSSRGCLRIVGYMIRKILGWVDANGNPTLEQLKFTYRELVEKSGVSHESIADAIAEAIERKFIRCLVQPARSSAGTQATNGVYELCWDKDSDYTNNPHEFRGFFYPEAMVDNDGDRPKAKAARKNIPNAFFEEVIPNEKLSVIRVVGCLLFYSITWGPAGERKQPVRKSITDLSNLTKISRQHVHKAVIEAIESGYLERTTEGTFNSQNRNESQAAEYGVRWTSADPKSGTHQVHEVHLVVTQKEAASGHVQTSEQANSGPSTEGPVRKGVRRKSTVLDDLSEKVYEGTGGPVRKGVRDHSEKVYEDLSEKVPSISIKTGSVKTTTAADTPALPVENVVAAAAVSLAAQQLTKVGFDGAAALQLAERYSNEDIRKQIAWIEKRKPSNNRLGMLRRAIEQNWPEPKFETRDLATLFPLGVPFVQAYYAAYHGTKGPTQTEPLEADAAAAEVFVKGLTSLGNSMATELLGARFGRLVRNEHERSPGSKPFLRTALAMYGAKLSSTVQADIRESTREAAKSARKAQDVSNEDGWLSYLRLEEKRLQEENGDSYEEFLGAWNRDLDEQVRVLKLSSTTLGKLKNEGSRLRAFAEHFAKHSAFPVLDIESWRKNGANGRFESGRKV